MIRKIGLKNFKAFKNISSVEIKPITIFCGTNSCGKSSILQSLLLLKQSLESQDPYKTFLLNGRFVHLGSFQNIIYDKNIDNIVTFDFTFKLTKSIVTSLFREKKIPLSYIIREFLSSSETRSKWKDLNIHFGVSLKVPEKGVVEYLRPIIVSSLFMSTLLIDENGIELEQSNVKFSIIKNNEYELEWNNLKSRTTRSKKEDKVSGKQKCKINFSNLLPMGISIEGDNDEERRVLDPIFYTRMLGDVLREIFDSYSYLGPLRENPSRRYIYEDEVVEIGLKGEKAAYLYYAELEKEIKQHYFYDKLTDSFSIEEKINLKSAVQKWLDLMGIEGFKPEALNEIISLNMHANKFLNTSVSIADVGFGISQIFPIILEGLRIPIGSTLLLEQPEIHLHPNLQMQMADYFISLALSGKNIIAETHSDHVINRLVRRIVEDEKNNLADKISIYFISQSEEGSFVEPIKIDEKRGIINWPKGFFDQTATEQEMIIRAGLRKRNNSSSIK